MVERYETVKTIGLSSLGSFAGSVRGALEGFVGGFALPTSVRSLIENGADYHNKLARRSRFEETHWRVAHLAEDAFRVSTRLATHAYLAYQTAAYFVEHGPEGIGLNLPTAMLLTNAASGLVEIVKGTTAGRQHEDPV